MAQLRDTLIQGSARVTDTLYTNTLQLNSILAPTASNGTTYGTGTGGYVLKSNGTNIYWTTDSDIKVGQNASDDLAGNYEVLLSATADNQTRTEQTRKTSTLTYNPNTKELVVSGGKVTAEQLSTNTFLNFRRSDGPSYIMLPDSKDLIINNGNTNGTAYADLQIGKTGILNAYGGSLGSTTYPWGQIFNKGYNYHYANNSQYISTVYGNAAQTTVGEFFYNVGDKTYISKGQFGLLEWAPKSTADTTTCGHYEQYLFPEATADIIENKSYNILTTKSTVTVPQGGTGTTTFTSNAVLYGNGTGAIQAKASANGALYATAANGSLSWGTLPIAQGGTGTATAPTQYGVIYASSTTSYASTGAGTSGYLLQSNATSAPSWIQATDQNVVNTIIKRDNTGAFSTQAITTVGNVTTTGGYIVAGQSTTNQEFRLVATSTGGDIYLYSNNGYSGIYAHNASNTGVHVFRLNQSNQIDQLAPISANVTISGTVTLTKTTDAQGDENKSPALIVGGDVTAPHLEFDGNEIMAKETATTTASLWLNNQGGAVWTGENLRAKGSQISMCASDAKGSNASGTGGAKKCILSFYETGTGVADANRLGTVESYRYQSGHENYANYNMTIIRAYANTANSTTSAYFGLAISPDGNTKRTITSAKIYGAVWNDYAEYRKQLYKIEPGYVVYDRDDGYILPTDRRLQPGAQVVSDTFGFAIGETNECQTPLAVTGRVLVYTYRDRYEYHAGDAVCSAPDGTVDIMTREEIKEYPDAIIGIVSEIPNYTTWGTGNIPVNGRIWIKVR